MAANEAANLHKENFQMKTLKEANGRLRSCSFYSLNQSQVSLCKINSKLYSLALTILNAQDHNISIHPQIQR